MSIGVCTMLLTLAQRFGDHVFVAMLTFCFVLGKGLFTNDVSIFWGL